MNDNYTPTIEEKLMLRITKAEILEKEAEKAGDIDRALLLKCQILELSELVRAYQDNDEILSI